MGKIRVAINGFGRIGRITYRAMVANENMELIVNKDYTTIKGNFKDYDSLFGTLSALEFLNLTLICVQATSNNNY